MTDIGNDGCNFSYSGTDCGYNVDTTTGEMAHLFYDELGNLAYCSTTGNCPQPGWGLTNTGPFNNLQPVSYWSYNEYDLYTVVEWHFDFYYGDQDNLNWDDYYALAVRPGDVSAGGPASVPEPATMLLLGTGLAGLAAFRKRPGRIHR